MGSKDRTASPASLAAFMRNKQRAACPVCQLPADVRAQLGPDATRRGFSRQDQVDWLRTALGISTVTLAVLAAHLSAHHDQEETA